MRVRATIQLLTTAAGGRAEPLRGNARPNHSFTGGAFLIGQIEQKPDEELVPGESAERIVDFVPDGLPLLTPGTRWDIFDGPAKMIGYGTVLAIVDG